MDDMKLSKSVVKRLRAQGGLHTDSYALAVRHCKAVVNSWVNMRSDQMRIQCGEMTGEEIRTVKAVLIAIRSRFESMERKTDCQGEERGHGDR